MLITATLSVTTSQDDKRRMLNVSVAVAGSSPAARIQRGTNRNHRELCAFFDAYRWKCLAMSSSLSQVSNEFGDPSSLNQRRGRAVTCSKSSRSVHLFNVSFDPPYPGFKVSQAHLRKSCSTSSRRPVAPLRVKMTRAD